MMLVRRKALGGVYSVLSWDSHSTRVRPNSWWAREFAIVYVCMCGCGVCGRYCCVKRQEDVDGVVEVQAGDV